MQSPDTKGRQPARAHTVMAMVGEDTAEVRS